MAFFFCFFTRPVQGQGRHALMIIYFAFVQKKREGGTGRGRGHCISIYRVASRAIMTREVEAAAEVAGNDVE